MVAPMFITFGLHWLFCYLFLCDLRHICHLPINLTVVRIKVIKVIKLMQGYLMPKSRSSTANACFYVRECYVCVVGSVDCGLKAERLGYVCNPRSLKEGTETSRRRTDELGYRLERPIHFECKLNEPMHIGMRLLHPAAADHSVSINRQQVQRIFRFSLRSRAGNRPLSGGTGAVATGRDVSVPSFRERGLHT